MRQVFSTQRVALARPRPPTKDLVDLHHLVNHNREGKTPKQLQPAASREERASTSMLVIDSIRRRPEYATELRAIKRWLDS